MKLKWLWAGHKARRADGRWDPRCWSGDFARESAVLADRQSDGLTTINKSQGVPGCKWRRTVLAGNHCRRALSSSPSAETNEWTLQYLIGSVLSQYRRNLPKNLSLSRYVFSQHRRLITKTVFVKYTPFELIFIIYCTKIWYRNHTPPSY